MTRSSTLLLPFFFLVFCFFALTDRFALFVAVSRNRVERRTGVLPCYLPADRAAPEKTGGEIGMLGSGRLRGE